MEIRFIKNEQRCSKILFLEIFLCLFTEIHNIFDIKTFLIYLKVENNRFY